MKLSHSSLVLLGLAAPSIAASVKTGAQHKPKPNAHRAKAVKETYQYSWQAYHQHTFPNDTLAPVNGSYINDRNQWGASAIDAITTAIIMEDEDSLNQILDFVPTIDFTTTAEPGDVSLFETNIRFFGGLMSAYDLLQDKKNKKMVRNKSNINACLKQAKTLADTLKFAFDTPTGIPDPTIQLNPHPKRNGSTVNNLAEAGTLVLEWTRLSDLTGDDQYAKLAQKAESYFLHPTPKSSEPFPGLTGTYVSLSNGSFTNSEGGWGGLTDSFYEYLIKMYLYDPDNFGEYKDRWVAAADSTMKFLPSHPSTRDDITFLAGWDGTDLIPVSSNLASFAGGNFILGGILLSEQKYIDFGVMLAENYFKAYRGTVTGIGPEEFQWYDSTLPASNKHNTNPPPEEKAMYEKSGFWATSKQYILRPETLESLYYAYRVTGDTKFQDMAWEAYQAIEANCKTGVAYSSLEDVTSQDGGFINKMESFWMAETLKYLYLIFAEDSDVQVQASKPMKYVFNTEAHPMRIRS